MIYAIALIGIVLGAVIGFVLGGRRSQAQGDEVRRAAESEGRERGARLEAASRETADKLVAGAREQADKVVAAAREQADRSQGAAREEAETIVKRARLEADEARLATERATERDLKQRRSEIEKLEERIVSREEKLDERASALDRKQQELVDADKALQRTTQQLDERGRALADREAGIESRIAAVAGMTPEEARAHVIASITEQARLDAAKAARQIEEAATEEAERRAKKVLAVAIQRYAGEYVTERTVSVINLPNEELKGRIIGREGRNIRAIEAATGVDFIIDDTPEAIIISAFDPVRREIARMSVERLLSDGRIHPTRIEEVVAKAKSDMERIVKDAGEQASFELGLTGLHPEVIKMMGRLKYRTSYGQNMWAHSIEVGWLCGLMAEELRLNVKLARRCGFLHDIGKAMDHDATLAQEAGGGHAVIGGMFIKKHGEDELVVNAVAAHHDEVKQNSVYAHLVIAADALSGARPGARREVLESYVKRLEDLERISRGFPGVDKAYAVQAGREVRVMVEHTKVTDDQALLLSRDIARKIEEELTYPGQIRVTVIRETRATEVAR